MRFFDKSQKTLFIKRHLKGGKSDTKNSFKLCSVRKRTKNSVSMEKTLEQSCELSSDTIDLKPFVKCSKG
jgi:hypothetical protein